MNTIGLVARLLAYLAIIGGFVIEFGGYPYPNASGAMITGGVVVLLVLALRRAWITRGRMGGRRDD